MYYSVTTWDAEREAYTPQDAGHVNLTLWELRRALRELRRQWGYSCRRRRDRYGGHDGDHDVLVEAHEEPREVDCG